MSPTTGISITCDIRPARRGIYRLLRANGMTAMEAIEALHGPGPLPAVSRIVKLASNGDRSAMATMQRWVAKPRRPR